MNEDLITRIGAWLRKRRTAEHYAFTVLEIAAGMGIPPAVVAGACHMALRTHELAFVMTDRQVYYTDQEVGFPAEAGKARLREMQKREIVLNEGGVWKWM